MSEDGGSAFPVPDRVEYPHTGIDPGSCGMTLRDYFAGQALAGYMALPDNRTFSEKSGKSVEEWRAWLKKEDAEHMYAMADAMLAARTKEYKR